MGSNLSDERILVSVFFQLTVGKMELKNLAIFKTIYLWQYGNGYIYTHCLLPNGDFTSKTEKFDIG
jgi:hypothetical protein